METDQACDIQKRLSTAILYLSSVCDGAIEEDGKGFNGCDADWGKRMARSISHGAGLNVEVIDAIVSVKKMR